MQHVGAQQAGCGVVGAQIEGLREVGHRPNVLSKAVLRLGGEIEHARVVGAVGKQGGGALFQLAELLKLAQRLQQHELQVVVARLVGGKRFEQGQGFGILPHAQVRLGLESLRAAVAGRDVQRLFKTFEGKRHFAHLHGTHAVVAQRFKVAACGGLGLLFGRKVFGRAEKFFQERHIYIILCIGFALAILLKKQGRGGFEGRFCAICCA